jgi:hypothetical protein
MKDELALVERNVRRTKRNGTDEWVNQYLIFGKERPALVLGKVRGDKSWFFIVWYTCTRFGEVRHGIEVSHITKLRPPKRAFLSRHAGHIRLIPQTPAWCGGFIGRPDRTIFDSFLKEAQKVPFLRR